MWQHLESWVSLGDDSLEGSEPTRGNSQGKRRLLAVGKLPWEHSSPQAPPKTQAPTPKSGAPASGDR